MYRSVVVTLALAWLAAGASAAWAYPTDLNVVPTAETLKAGSVSVQWEMDSPGLPGDRRSTPLLLTQVGITDRLEAGIDFYDVGDSSRGYANAKFALLREKDGMPALAVGAWNLAEGVTAQPYLVATSTFGITGVHLGTLRAGGQWEGMAGIGLALGGGWRVQADGLTGNGGYATLGASYTLANGWAIQLYRSRARDRDARADFTGLNISWKSPLFR